MSSEEVIGAARHSNRTDRDQVRIELLSGDASKISTIDDQTLSRLSVQSSLRRQLGLETDRRSLQPFEHCIAEIIIDVYGSYALLPEDATLFRWHQMLMTGNRHINLVGACRARTGAMQIVSGNLDRLTIHFEARPSEQVPGGIDPFFAWFNETAPNDTSPLPTLNRAGLSHIWFESIYPFEDSNGRQGRALTEKAIAQSLGQPSLIMLSFAVKQSRKALLRAT